MGKKEKHVHEFVKKLNPLAAVGIYYAAQNCRCGKWRQLDGSITNSSSGRTKHGRK